MFATISEFTVAPDDRDAFETSFAASMQNTLVGVPGLRRSLLLRPGTHSTDRGYLAIMEFADETAYDTYVASEAFHSSHSGPRKSLASGFSVADFESVVELIG